MKQSRPQQARAIAIPMATQREQARRQQLAMRIAGALVGLTLVAGGLLTALQAHAGTSSTTAATAATAASAKPAASASAAAASHGTVQAVRAVEVKGKGSGLGVVTGAVLGGLVGNQMGKGTGNAVMTVGGAVAGGYAGNEVEKHAKRQTLFKTTVKLDDGTVRDFTVGQQFAVGAKVKVSGKKLTSAD